MAYNKLLNNTVEIIFKHLPFTFKFNFFFQETIIHLIQG